MKKSMTLGLISGTDARYIGMAASVAGGWIMADETGTDITSRIDPFGDSYLAAIPDHFLVAVKSIDPQTVLAMLDKWIKRDINRTYCQWTKTSDVARQTEWHDRISREFSPTKN